MKISQLCIVIGVQCICASGIIVTHTTNQDISKSELSRLRNESVYFASSAKALETAVDQMDNRQTITIKKARESLRQCRLQYKRIAFYLEYFYPQEARLFNGPPEPDINDSDLRYSEPAGLQVMESILFDQDIAKQKKELQRLAHNMTKSAVGIPALLSGSNSTDDQLLESFRLELIRVMTLYITGYDAPKLKSGVAEAGESLNAISDGISPYVKRFSANDSILFYLNAGRQFIKANHDFDSFDRLGFLTRFALPLQRNLNQLSLDANMKLNTVAVLNADAKDLFCANTFNKKAFPDAENETDTLLVSLGKKLFFEKALSGNYSRSCVSCHSPDAYFADGLRRNKSLDGSSLLPRNTPSLLYVCYQYDQFWDGRAKGLDTQIAAVLKNKNEMNGQSDTIVSRLRNNTYYKNQFEKIWTDSGETISMKHVTGAIAAFIQTLTPFQSPFDQYMQGNRSALSVSQQRGFNIFMGKGQCATCHFVPLFNGLTPPFYDVTGFEIL
ncbi:MAG TPA: cytochrome-c peroxidase, partial [Puia sp.]|nr:cytochrome-c peroxidase [Puia sp.]